MISPQDVAGAAGRFAVPATLAVTLNSANLLDVAKLLLPIMATIWLDGRRTRRKSADRLAKLEERTRQHAAILHRHLADKSAHPRTTPPAPAPQPRPAT